jgi:hypothetical protein
MSDVPKKPLLNGRPLRQGHLLYDEQQKNELRDRQAKIAALRARSDVEIWQEGDEFSHVKTKKLYRQAGFNGFEKWVLSIGRVPRTVNRYVRFADSFSLAEVKTYTRELLELAGDYAMLTVGKRNEWSVGQLRVHVPGVADPVPFAKITVEQLQAAVDHQYELHERRLQERVPSGVHAMAAQLTKSVTTETGRIARIEPRPSKTGREEDATVVIEARHGDLVSVLTRMLQALEPKRRGGGR